MLRRILGIDITDHCLRYVYCTKQNGSYVIQSEGRISSEEDLSSSGVLSGILLKILDNDDVRPQKIFVSVSHSEALVHQKVFPQMPKGDMEKVLAAEIDKIPKFTQQAFDVLYKAYPSVKRGRSRVIYAALKESFIQRILHEIRLTKIPVQSIEVSPLNLKELPKLIQKSVTTGAFLVLHDRHAYLTVYEKNEYRLMYIMPYGTDQLLSAATPEAQDLMLKDWAGEINRVLRSFELENKQLAIHMMHLVWDKSHLPTLDKRFEDHLNVNVEPFVISGLPKIYFSQAYTDNNIHALALTPIVCAINRVKEDFSFTHFLRSAFLKEYALKVAIRAMIIVSILIFFIGAFSHRMNVKTAEYIVQAEIASKEIKTIEEDSRRLFQLYSEYMLVKERLLEQASFVQELNRVSWTEVLSEIANDLPEDVAFTSFAFYESGQAQIKGDAFDMESIASLIRKTETSKILERGNFDYLKEQTKDDEKYFTFGILSRLKPNKEVSHDAE